MKNLYAVYLGGYLAEGRMGEDHEVVLAVGDDEREVKRQARAKWAGHGTAHVDAIQRIEVIDGCRIRLEEVGGVDETYLDIAYQPEDAPPPSAY
ncbi:MAG TPA: DUF1543 domain-containing protein [Acidimicrobiales bacterium]|nr:DUF1543 domain-containing protein [Acidimicrobiales bacterium]